MNTPAANSLIPRIHSYIATHNLMPAQSRIIIGLSGGPDSLFLLHLLASLQKTHAIHLIAAHLDHEWRAESAQEALFCAAACAQLGIPFVTQKISELNTTITANGSKEQYARRMRRHFFEHVKYTHSADYIALAHHAQDQQETFFIRLIRGATATGIAAMRPQHGPYIRPLLETNKSDILTYLHNHGISYLTDPTNASSDFLRNRIRHTVLRPLYVCDSRFEKNFQRTIQHLNSTEQFLETLTFQLFSQITQTIDQTDTPTTHTAQVTDTRDNKLTYNKIALNIPLFHVQEPFMQYRLLMRFMTHARVPFTPTQALLQEISRFLAISGNKTHQLHTHWSLVKKQPWAFIHQKAA